MRGEEDFMVTNTTGTYNPYILRFTGNWYIDLSILGFIKIMEYFYGWNLGELQKKLQKNGDYVFYVYFPVAYISFYLERKLDSLGIQGVIREEKFASLRREIKREITANNVLEHPKEELFEEIWEKYIQRLIDVSWRLSLKLFDQKTSKMLKKYEHIEDLIEQIQHKKFKKIFRDLKKRYNKNKKDIVLANLMEYCREKFMEHCEEEPKEFCELIERLYDSLEKVELKEKKVPIHSDYFLNFLIFNPTMQKYEKVKEAFLDIIKTNLQRNVLRKFDRTINKFLTSEGKSLNVFYTPTNAENIYRLLGFYPVVFLICFEAAFEYFRGLGWYVFYSPDLEFTYHVNKKLKLLTQQLGLRDILRLTWRAIIDSLYERHAKWVLEDMYIIKYRSITKQRIADVEYIGFDKVRASLILDDRIRSSLNIRINISDEEKPRRIWLLEAFLRGDDLYSLVLNYFRKKIRRKERVDYARSLITALAVEYSLRQKTRQYLRKFRLFDQLFFKGSFATVTKVYEYLRNVEYVSKIIGNILDSSLAEDIERIVSLIGMLLASVEKLDKNSFANLLLSELNKYSNTLHRGFLKKLYRDLFADNYWYLYALGLLISLYRRVGL